MNETNNIIQMKPHRGQKLRELRHARGLSLQALSGMVFVDPSTISRWESRREFHQFARFLKALYRLGTTPEEFLGVTAEELRGETPRAAIG
ncbi:MAG: helix-turn-helix transcriptional regulator [Planctomycetes bacterium]|nr:helix-turn-helix transcriptional regulator [Planctomycetota bacterium]